ncbi:unnamed protein product [Pieris macdunnoughi]|uniref:ZAD domain-containing protein n=1 Tax=Pieris macdunnoughi TaxID=345717 RepID=A0A821WG61_9NEOP|nr:unnamed protein product [Pieris macdunnoughi]
MDIYPEPCRICLSVSEFNVSLSGRYCTKRNMIAKILLYLKIIIAKTDRLKTICYKCMVSIEQIDDFITTITQSQNNFDKHYSRPKSRSPSISVTSFAQQENNAILKMKQSSPFFSYSPLNILVKPSNHQFLTFDTRLHNVKIDNQNDNLQMNPEASKHLSVDIFESQSDHEDVDLKRPD